MGGPGRSKTFGVTKRKGRVLADLTEYLGEEDRAVAETDGWEASAETPVPRAGACL